MTDACRCLDVNRSAYYSWKNAEPTEREERDASLSPIVRRIFYKHKKRYGARRIVAELKDLGHICGERKVAALLKTQGLKAIQPKSFKPKTTESRHRLGYNPNLLLDWSGPYCINQLWVGDITYIPLKNSRFNYLATLMDRYSRRIVGWHMSENMTGQLVVTALRMAIRERQPQAKMIHHSDRGGQYAGKTYRGILRRAQVRQSMSRAGNCYDNAFMELYCLS